MTPLKQKLKEGLEKRIYNEDEFIDEAITEDILANDYEFLKSGKRY